MSAPVCRVCFRPPSQHVFSVILASGTGSSLFEMARAWAAQMVSRGQARFAVLMDPVSGIPDLPGVLDAMMAKARASGPPDFGPMSEALSLWTDVHAR